MLLNSLKILIFIFYICILIYIILNFYKIANVKKKKKNKKFCDIQYFFN